ncbi:MAG TPA: NADH-quinone oxidoreductase subunit J [Armatimonadota bacterium]|jgi:NADH-quinone oxidoreductase subunit J
MDIVFFLAAAIALGATVMVITRLNAVHALLYLIVSLLALAVVFFTLGAPLVAALEVIIYAGAIMVLFVFALMILNLGKHTVAQERAWLTPRIWTGPALLAAVLLGELGWAVLTYRGRAMAGAVDPTLVGASLYSTYLLGVELASLILLAALVGAYHLARREEVAEEERP